jgi:hypothetical protein
MASVAGTCSNCGKGIGGTGHKHVSRSGHNHYKSVEDLKRRIRELYNKEKDKYWVSRTLGHDSDDYKNYDYFEGKKDRVSRILTHLFDQCYLLLYPILNYDSKEQIDMCYN